MHPDEDDNVIEVGSTLNLTCSYNVAALDHVNSGFNISWKLPNQLDNNKLVGNIYILSSIWWSMNDNFLGRSINNFINFHTMRWALHQRNDRLRISYGKETDKQGLTTNIWSAITLTNTKATDTGYYSCEIITDDYFAISLSDFLRKKYVYFFGSHLFNFGSLGDFMKTHF